MGGPARAFGGSGDKHETAAVYHLEIAKALGSQIRTRLAHADMVIE
jgi:hypothetical protein